MLEFISSNTNNITLIITVIAGLFAFVKWIDSRDQKLKNERYQKYIQLVRTLSGSRDSKDAMICMTEQIASAWLLLEYKEYYELTLKILDNADLEMMANKPWKEFVLPQIKMVVQSIREMQK